MEDLHIFDEMMKEAAWFYNHNNLDIVNSILDDIYVENPIYIWAFWLANTNEEYGLYNIDFVNYVHNFDIKYTSLKVFGEL